MIVWEKMSKCRVDTFTVDGVPTFFHTDLGQGCEIFSILDPKLLEMVEILAIPREFLLDEIPQGAYLTQNMLKMEHDAIYFCITWYETNPNFEWTIDDSIEYTTIYMV